MRHNVELHQQLRVAPNTTLAERFRAAGIAYIDPCVEERYRDETAKQSPGTNLGRWLVNRGVPVKVFNLLTTLGTILACLAWAIPFTLIIMNGSLLGFVGVFLGLLAAVVGCIVSTYSVATKWWRNDIYPSWWSEPVSWPDKRSDPNRYLRFAIPPSVENHREKIARHFPDLIFKIRSFYQHGIFEDPIGYAVDPTTGESLPFRIWVPGVDVTNMIRV